GIVKAATGEVDGAFPIIVRNDVQHHDAVLGQGGLGQVDVDIVQDQGGILFLDQATLQYVLLVHGYPDLVGGIIDNVLVAQGILAEIRPATFQDELELCFGIVTGDPVHEVLDGPSGLGGLPPEKVIGIGVIHHVPGPVTVFVVGELGGDRGTFI